MPSRNWVKRIVPSVPQVAPPSVCAGQIVRAGPPVTATFFSAPSPGEKNPTKRRSGDQNGETAPSVPDSGSADTESSGRNQICCFPSADATIAQPPPAGG